MSTEKFIKESIVSESDLVAKLRPLAETEIFDFMQNLRGGTYFNMGMYSSIPVSRAYKPTYRIYKVTNMTAIVSGVSYENIGTTKDFRDRTGKGPGGAWYDHMAGFENKVGLKKSDPTSKYVLWDVKAGTGTWVGFYLVDIATGLVTPLSRDEVLDSEYLTNTEKAKLTPKRVEGFDKTTGELIENQTTWRTAAFEHIFWLSQGGKSTKEYGIKFTESKKDMNKNNLEEARDTELFMDVHAGVTTDLDAILSGSMDEEYQKSLAEAVENTEIKGVRTITLHNDTGESVVLTFNTFEEAAKHFDNLYVNAVEDNYAEEVLYPILNAAKTEEYDYIDEDGYAVIKVDATGIFDNALDGLYEDNTEESYNESLKESYRRIISRGTSLINNELFVDFE